MPSANDVRQQFIDFFVQKHGHTAVPSAPVVPLDDPTLLFTNAGMNQFKDVFLGTGSRPYKRAVDTQKCIRAGGKHNDLDDVGKDTYHHTFFEMLGNWSFGDYFKKEAITWAWELLTEVWQMDKSRLHVTVFEGDEEAKIPRDDEAAQIWRGVGVDPAHIHLGNKKDNFWEMGETGPCGPCTEIHYDRTPDKTGRDLVNKGSPDVIEIWNNVFIQFNRNEDRSLTPLPAQHVDTGMGFERITAVLQGKSSNYDTDVFTPIFAAIQAITNAPAYTGDLADLKDIAYRVIGDHIRTLTFALTDGAQIGNEGRNYVLKRILRRAERYGRQYLGATKPFLCDLVNVVVETMGGAFPELKRAPERVAAALKNEEESFIRTLDRGITLFEDAANRSRADGTTAIRGEDAFQLHDTFGLYIDITEQMASEAGLTVDRARFETLLEEAKEKSRQGSKKIGVSAITGELPPTDDSQKYKGLICKGMFGKGKVVAWMKDNLVGASGKLGPGDQVALVLDKTSFYAEQGGQVGDTGWIRTKTGTFEVTDTQRLGDAVLHIGKVHEGTIKIGQSAMLETGVGRIDTMRNHTATHMLNWALRKVLGDHIDQKGSLVDPARLRFDFSHNDPLSREQILEVEKFVNQKVQDGLPVSAFVMSLEEAKKLNGVRAVFGEKYPDPVRVLVIGSKNVEGNLSDASVEFCGGTHLGNTAWTGLFKIVGQELVAKGVRRLVAVTGTEAVATVQRLSGVVDDLTARFRCKPDEIAGRIDSLQDEIKKLQQQLKKGAATDLAGAGDKLFADATKSGDTHIIVGEFPAAPDEQIRNQVDRLKQKAGSSVIVIGWKDDGKVGLLASVSDDLFAKIKAGDLIKQIAPLVGGGGGGRPNLAQAGGKNPEKLGDALESAKKLVNESLSRPSA